MKKQYITLRAVCPVCNGKESPGGIMIDDRACQHCADTGFVNIPFELKEGEPVVEAFVDTKAQAAVKVAVAIIIGAVAIIIGALALLGFTAFAIWSGF